MSGVFDNLDYVIEQCFEENGNINVRISHDVVVLTQEESNRVIARFKLLQAENAKLRELAAILCYCMQIKASCDDCRIGGRKGELARDPLCACDGLHRMLRELGVEVDQ